MGDPQRLLEAREAFPTVGPGDPEPTRFAFVPACADAEGEPPARQHVDGGRRLHQQSGLTEEGAPDQCPEAQAVGDAGQEAEGCIRLEHRLVRAAPTGIGGKLKEVVHHPQRLEPGGLRGLCDFAELGSQPRRATRDR